MPNNIIPINSDVPNITALPDVRATPSDMGAQVGAAMGNVGDAATRAVVAMREYQERNDGVDGQLSLATLHQNTTAARIAMQNSPDAGTPAAMDRFNQQYQSLYQKAFDGLPNNPKVQNAFKVGAADMFTGQVDSAMQSQASQAGQLQAQKAQQTLSTYVNTIQTDASQYNTSLKGGDALIAGLSLPPDQTNQLRQNFHDAAIAGRFDAMFRGAKSPDAIDGIIKDLSSGNWKDQMTASKFNDLLRLGASAQKSAQKVVNEQATAAVTSAEDRINGGAVVDPADMAAIGGAVKQSNNPLLLDKWVRLQVKNDTTQKVKGMSSSAIGQYVASNTGNAPMTPGVATARMQDGFGYLKSKYGLSDTDAVGVLSNIGRETGFNPRPGDGGTSDGYFQWHNDRMVNARAAGAAGTDIRKAIDFAMNEPEGKAFLSQAGSFRTPGQAAQAWMQVFEKPANPSADQPINEKWASRVIQSVNGGRPMVDIAPGREDEANANYPSEYEWIRAQAAQKVLTQRNKLVSDGNQITAASEAGLFNLNPLNNQTDFQERAQQSQVATGFVGSKTNKPFTPDEAAAFAGVMQTGSLQQKTQLLQNVASMGTVAPAAFKQLGEKAPVLSAVGGLNNYSPAVAQDVLRGVQAMQENPDLKEQLSNTSTGLTGGTATEFNKVVGTAMGSMPSTAYAMRQAADALYIQRAGPGATWNADLYDQAVREVVGGPAGNTAGGVATINKQPTFMPPGVDGDEFQTMLHSLTPQDLIEHSTGGSPPLYADGTPASADDIAGEGQFKAISAGLYNIYMGDGKPLMGSGRQGLYEFGIDAKGVSNILNRTPPTALPLLKLDPQLPAPDPLQQKVQQTLPDTQAQSGGMNSVLMGDNPADYNAPPSSFWRVPTKEDVHNALGLKVKQ